LKKQILNSLGGFNESKIWYQNMNAFVKNTPHPHIVTFKYGELFCGPGGLALGAKISKVMKDDIVYRLDHVWAADYDADSCDTYKHNICPDTPKIIICSDAKKL
jgi:hypothetical protein